MNFFSRLRAVFNQKRFDEMVSDWLAGEDVKRSDIDVYGSNALRFTAVFACARVLAETFASVPVFEYRRDKDGDREKTDDTGLYDILHNAFNDDMTAFNAKEMGMYQISLGGNAFYQKIPTVGGGLHSLYPIAWERVKIDVDKDTNRIVYIIDGKKDAPRTRETMFHIPGPSVNGIVGMSPAEYAAQAIYLGLTYETFQTNFYKNGALTTGVFERPGPGALQDEAYRRLKKDLKEKYTGLANANEPLLLEDGLQFKQLSMKLVDAELLSSKKFQIEDICRIYRVPLHLVQNLDRATNNNIEHQSLEFAMYTMLPHFKRWEENINTQLLTRAQRRAGYYFEFNMNALLRGDQESMAKAFAAGRQWGWLSVNDIRRMLNLNRVENGDIYLQPINMMEAGTEVLSDAVNKGVISEAIKGHLQYMLMSKAGEVPVNGKVRDEVEDLILASEKVE